MWVVLILLIASCNPYKTPQTGVYVMTVEIVEDTQAVRDKCKIGIGEVACTTMSNPCHIVLSMDDWDMYVEHEVAHCLKVYSHF